MEPECRLFLRPAVMKLKTQEKEFVEISHMQWSDDIIINRDKRDRAN